MITVDCWIEGTTPILLHRATEADLMGSTRTNTVKEREDPRTIAGKHVYRIGDAEHGQLAVPGPAFSRLLREAGGSHKARGSRKSLKFIVPAAVLVLDELCGLYLRDRKTKLVDFEVDARSGVIPATKGRVMIWRARANEWAVKIRLRINEDLLAESLVRQLMAEGTQQIGIGAFRPEKGGPFGTASIVAWDVVSEPKPKTEAQKRNGESSRSQAESS